MYYISTVTLLLTIVLAIVLVNAKPIQENKKLYKWEIDSNERKRLGKLLGRDFNDEKIKNIKGTIVDGPRMNCNNCGKRSELIDFIHTSIKQNVHSKDFMIKALKESTPNTSPPHVLECSNCESKFLEKRGWATGHSFNWVYRDVEEKEESIEELEVV
jgi:hypothetical protein